MTKKHLSLVSPSDKPKRAALYIRVSTQHQIDKESLDFQRQDLINYCQYALNISDYTVFEDAGYSAKSTARPQYQEMMYAMRRGEYSHLIVWKLDRISRNLQDFTEMWEELGELRVSFVSRQEQFDTSTPIGEAMLRIIIVFAELERKMTSERVTAVMMARAARGDWNGARLPLGYDWDEATKKLIINQDEALTIKFIYDNYEKTNSALTVTTLLVENSYKTKRGGNWGSKPVVDILRNPLYMGTMRYNYRESARGRKKPEEEVIYSEDAVPPIITKKQWNRVQERMDRNRNCRFSGLRGTHTHALSGLCRCLRCGTKSIASLSSRPHAGGYRPSRYRCGLQSRTGTCNNKALSGLVGEPFILEYIRSLVFPHKFALNAFEDRHGVAHTTTPATSLTVNPQQDNETSSNEQQPISKDLAKLEELKKKKRKIELALSRLDDLYYFSDEGTPSAMTKVEYRTKHSDWTNKLASIDDQIAALNRSTSATQTADMSEIQRVAIVSKLAEHDDLRKALPYLDRNMIAEFVQSMVEEIGVLDGRIASLKFRGNNDPHLFLYNEKAAE